MSRKSKLKLISHRTEEDQQRRREEYDRWKNAEEDLKITPHEARQRVRALRDELERYQQQMEALPFDIPSGDGEMPLCLDSEGRKYHIELVEQLNPLVNGVMEMIDAYAKERGCHEKLDFQAELYEVKSQAAWTGYQIGVLAGVIFAGCSKEQIDRFERGFVYSLHSNSYVVKG